VKQKFEIVNKSKIVDFFIVKLAGNAPPAAAVGDLLVLIFAYLYH
jgi:hypothetical protein